MCKQRVLPKIIILSKQFSDSWNWRNPHEQTNHSKGQTATRYGEYSMEGCVDTTSIPLIGLDIYNYTLCIQLYTYIIHMGCSILGSKMPMVTKCGFRMPFCACSSTHELFWKVLLNLWKPYWIQHKLSYLSDDWSSIAFSGKSTDKRITEKVKTYTFTSCSVELLSDLHVSAGLKRNNTQINHPMLYYKCWRAGDGQFWTKYIRHRIKIFCDFVIFTVKQKMGEEINK